MNMQIQAQRSNPAPKPQWTLTRGAIILTMPVVASSSVFPAPTHQLIADEPNAHVRAYCSREAEREGLTPVQFVRLQAKAEGINYGIQISMDYQRKFYPHRKAVIMKTVERFPHLTSPQLGRLFHRDHTSILWTLGRTARAKRAAQ